MSSEPSKTIPPAPTAPAWSPDQKLRADATDEQITARFRFLLNEVPPIVSHPASGVVGPQVVREFAAALRAKFDAQHDDIWMHGELAGRDSVVAADAEPTPRKPYNGDVCGMCGGEYSLNGDGTWRPTHYPKCPRAFEPVLRGGAPASGGETPK